MNPTIFLEGGIMSPGPKSDSEDRRFIDAVLIVVLFFAALCAAAMEVGRENDQSSVSRNLQSQLDNTAEELKKVQLQARSTACIASGGNWDESLCINGGSFYVQYRTEECRDGTWDAELDSCTPLKPTPMTTIPVSSKCNGNC